MVILQEKAVFRGVMLEVELHDDLRFRLCYGEVVEYFPGGKKIRNRTFPYDFKSVEKLRYDFERDLAAVGVNLG